MKLFDKVTIIFTIGISVIMLALGLYLWDGIPDPFPSTISEEGEVVDTMSRTFAVIIFPLLMILVTGLAIYVGRHREKFNNVNEKLIYVAAWVTPMMSITMCGSWYTNAYGLWEVQNQLVYSVLGLILIMVGVALAKTYQSEKFGIRTPWSLSSQKNWKITNVVGGVCFIVAGIAISLWGTWFMFNIWAEKIFVYVLCGIIALMILVPILTSYSMAKALHEEPKNKTVTVQDIQPTIKKTKISNNSKKKKR